MFSLLLKTLEYVKPITQKCQLIAGQNLLTFVYGTRDFDMGYWNF